MNCIILFKRQKLRHEYSFVVLGFVLKDLVLRSKVFKVETRGFSLDKARFCDTLETVINAVWSKHNPARFMTCVRSNSNGE